MQAEELRSDRARGSHYSCILLMLLLGWVWGVIPVQAQQEITQDYLIGSQLLRQGEYERALGIFSELVKNNPGNYLNLEGFVQACTQLKRYDEALSALQRYLKQHPNDVAITTRLGQIHHQKGDTLSAYRVWSAAANLEPTNPNSYRIIAESMQDRKEYKRAAQLYQTAKLSLNDPTLYLFELSNLYLLAGEFKPAATAFLELLARYPDRLSYVQRQYSRFNEKELVDATLLESDERLKQWLPTDQRVAVMREFQLWLLLERGLYRRAMALARRMDAEGNRENPALFGVAQRLLSQNEFEWSEQAFKVYADQPTHFLASRSTEELAMVYLRWARYLMSKNLDTGAQIDQLYRKADLTLQALRQQFPGYERRVHVVLLQTEIALDYLKDVSLANSYYQTLQQFDEATQFKNEIEYLEGRILLAQGSFNAARVAFTRANTGSKIGDLAEKTRYFLALTDFFSREYDFAGIQLKALERQSASLYANDALQLRLWMMDGVNRDSTTTEIDLFSQANLALFKGDSTDVITTTSTLIARYPTHALADDAVLLLSKTMRNRSWNLAFDRVHAFIEATEASKITEELLWERAQLATRIPSIDPVPYFEEVLMRFPQGFYSNAVREQLRTIKTTIQQ